MQDERQIDTYFKCIPSPPKSFTMKYMPKLVSEKKKGYTDENSHIHGKQPYTKSNGLTGKLKGNFDVLCPVAFKSTGGGYSV